MGLTTNFAFFYFAFTPPPASLLRYSTYSILAPCLIVFLEIVILCTVGAPSSSHIARQSRYSLSTGPYLQSSRKGPMMRDKMWEGIKRHIHPLGGFEQAVLIDARPGYAKFSIEITKDALNLYGITHGGFLFTLCDMAAGMAAYAYEIENTTQQASISFLKGLPPETGKLYVECRSAHRGRSSVVNQVEITTESGALAVVGTFTMFLLRPVE